VHTAQREGAQAGGARSCERRPSVRSASVHTTTFGFAVHFCTSVQMAAAPWAVDDANDEYDWHWHILTMIAEMDADAVAGSVDDVGDDWFHSLRTLQRDEGPCTYVYVCRLVHCLQASISPMRTLVDSCLHHAMRHLWTTLTLPIDDGATHVAPFPSFVKTSCLCLTEGFEIVPMTTDSA
jgi:hypothetical protein